MKSLTAFSNNPKSVVLSFTAAKNVSDGGAFFELVLFKAKKDKHINRFTNKLARPGTGVRKCRTTLQCHGDPII